MRSRSLIRCLMIAMLAAGPTVGTALAQQTRPATSQPAKRPPPVPGVQQGRDGKLVYAEYPRGDRVPDFSFAGYAAGEKQIPTVPAKLLAGDVNADDNTRAIQAAIDECGQLPPDADGMRGAVLIPPGEFKVAGTIALNVSGVVLRGSGMGRDATTLLATGTDRRTVIEVRGRPPEPAGPTQPISDAYVPVNAVKLSVSDASSFAPGDVIRLTRPSAPEWIVALGMDDFGGDRHGPSWRPGSRDVVFLRTITKVDGATITLDAPLTISLDQQFGGATIGEIDASGLVQHVGVENLNIVSTFDPANEKDEEHAWFGVGINHARDVWVRQVTFKHLAGSAVAAWEGSSRVTVEDCISLAPVGEVGGLRRNTFFTTGQQVLMQRLYSESGVHDFSVGFAAPGPNAFVQCEAVNSFGESGPIGSAACGTLMDRVRIDGGALSLRNRAYQGQGTGWASFNGVIWNSTAPLINCERPPGAYNWSVGANGEYNGNGAFASSADTVNPDSLYYGQLAERVGTDVAAKRAQLNLPPVQGTRAPTLESAAEAIAASMKPRVTMADWILDAAKRNPIPTSADGVAHAKPPAAVVDQLAAAPKRIAITNGWITIDGQVVVGGQMGVPWWSGGVRPSDLEKANPALTRFVPGRSGKGLTDELDELARSMKERGIVSVFQHPPLWYERRRDDHERVRRLDGDVVAPFYEVPWARSGQGSASDGLSRWDVTKTNTWYFSRLRQFADLAEQHGLVLYNGLYQQHSILEAGAHYADAPWRTANNINPVGIPEPVFFAGDKLIYVAEQFYDVSNPDRAKLHRTYMRNALNELAGKPNVIFFLSEEYTGPLAFTQFWLDTIAEWRKETGKQPLIALYATKDVTDAILSDPQRAAVVSIILNHEASYYVNSDGSWYAPQGGKNLAPRQWQRLLKPKAPGFDEVLATVREYRMKYPDKPFVYDAAGDAAWAVLLGGGSMPALPKTTDADFLKAVAGMQPVEPGISLAGDAGYIFLSREGGGPTVSVKPGVYDARVVHLDTGQADAAQRVSWDGKTPVLLPGIKGTHILWLSRIEK